jgi:hypothetical protein
MTLGTSVLVWYIASDRTLFHLAPMYHMLITALLSGPSFVTHNASSGKQGGGGRLS